VLTALTFRRLLSVFAAGVSVACSIAPACAQNSLTLHAQIRKKVEGKGKSAKATADASNVVVWLRPIGPRVEPSAGDPAGRKKLQLVQRDKSFHPHVLVVVLGSVVNFPNRDPYFHNVFSLYDGKKFDLGLYRAGATNSIKFDRAGVSYIYCNIHPEMSAVVVTVDTPYFGVSDRAGNISIANLPEGKYEMHLWYERSLPEDLKRLTRTIVVSGPSDLGTIGILENPSYSPAHKNKYGQDYAPLSLPN
jgi:plastocyanin